MGGGDPFGVVEGGCYRARFYVQCLQNYTFVVVVLPASNDVSKCLYRRLNQCRLQAIDWRRLFSLLFDEVNITIDGSLPVGVIGSAIFKGLGKLLEITPKR